jgi:hypothetical protein
MSAMDEYEGNGNLTETSLQLENTIDQIYNVLQSFEVLPTKFDRFIFNHIYIFLLGLLFGELLIVPPIISQSQYISLPQAEKWFLLVMLPMIVIISIILPFNVWRLSTRKMLTDLFEKKRVYIPDGDANTSYHCFLESYLYAVSSPKRYFVSGILMIVFATFSAYGLLKTFSFLHLGLFATILFVMGILLCNLSFLVGMYCGGVMCWVMYISGSYVRRLVHTFDLRIQPFHTDKCGGLKLLGNFCFGLVTPVLIGSGLIIGYILVYFISESITRSSIDAAYVPIFVGLPILFLLYVFPAIFFTFILPLGDIHAKMVREREEDEDTYNARIESLRENIQLQLKKGRVKVAKALQEKKAMLETFYTPYPTWPFSFRSTILYTILGASGSLLIGMVTAALPVILPLIYQKL